jgi:hypothetical protein
MTLERLEDEKAVVDTAVALFVATDRRDWKTVEGCFADSVLFDMTSLAGGAPAHLTPRQIADAWAEGLAPLEAIHHQAGNFQVTLRESDADLFCYATATHYRRVASGRNTRTFVGSYDFHLLRDGARWHIDAFRFNLKYLDGNLELHAEAPAV